jgi:hypothetical protein
VLPDQLLGVGVEEYLQTDDPEHPIVEYHRRALAGETLRGRSRITCRST